MSRRSYGSSYDSIDDSDEETEVIVVSSGKKLNFAAVLDEISRTSTDTKQLLDLAFDHASRSPPRRQDGEDPVTFHVYPSPGSAKASKTRTPHAQRDITQTASADSPIAAASPNADGRWIGAAQQNQSTLVYVDRGTSPPRSDGGQATNQQPPHSTTPVTKVIPQNDDRTVASVHSPAPSTTTGTAPRQVDTPQRAEHAVSDQRMTSSSGFTTLRVRDAFGAEHVMKVTIPVIECTSTWRQKRTPDGRLFWKNETTGEKSWTLPEN